MLWSREMDGEQHGSRLGTELSEDQETMLSEGEPVDTSIGK